MTWDYWDYWDFGRIGHFEGLSTLKALLYEGRIAYSKLSGHCYDEVGLITNAKGEMKNTKAY